MLRYPKCLLRTFVNRGIEIELKSRSHCMPILTFFIFILFFLFFSQGCRCGGMHLEQQAAKDYGDDPPSPMDATVPHNIHCSLYELARSKPFSKGQLCDLIQRFSASIKQNLMLPKLVQKKGNRSIKKYLCLPLRGKVFFVFFIVILLLFFNILGIIFTKIHIRLKLKCSSTGDKCVV